MPGDPKHMEGFWGGVRELRGRRQGLCVEQRSSLGAFSLEGTPFFGGFRGNSAFGSQKRQSNVQRLACLIHIQESPLHLALSVFARALNKRLGCTQQPSRPRKPIHTLPRGGVSLVA